MELNRKQKAAFGFGAFGKDVVYMLISGYLLYYYNTVLGMDSVFIGAVMMAARVFDAFNDPFMGIVVSKTHTRWGKFRPWIFVGTVTNAFTIYALYATPASLSAGAQKTWLAAFYIAWGVTYTLMDIPFWAMIPAITRPGTERENLSSLARSCSAIGDAIPTVATTIIVTRISHSKVPTDFAPGFRVWALIVAVTFIISEVIFVLTVPKEQTVEETKSAGIGEMFSSLFHNDQALTVVVSVILVYTALNIVGNLILYFFTYDVGNTDAYSMFTMVCFGTQVIVMVIFPLIRKFVGKLQLFLLGFVIQIAGFAVILLMAFTHFYQSAGWFVLCLPGIMVYAGFGVLNVLLTIFLSDSVDYGEYKNGSRDEAVIFSMQTFTVKLASGLAVLIAGIVIKVVHLQTEVLQQTEATLNGMRLWMTIPSIVLLVLGIIVFKKFYKLDDERLGEITTALQAKRDQ